MGNSQSLGSDQEGGGDVEEAPKGASELLDHRVSNATAEGFNSRIQAIKSAARGLRKFENYRVRILLFCGRLDLLPELTHQKSAKNHKKERPGWSPVSVFLTCYKLTP